MYIDGPTEQIAALLTDEVIREARRYAALRLLPHIERALREHSPQTRICTGEVAAVVLDAAIRSLARELYSDTDGYAALRWLWLLRRVPDWVFDGDYSTSHGYDRSLAEVITGAATGRSRVRDLDGDQRAYPFDSTVIRRLARYCASVRALSQLHREYRWASKGAPVEFARHSMPKPRPDEALRKSVELYDERGETGGGDRMGTEVFGPTRSVVDLRDALRTLDQHPKSTIVRLLPLRPPRPMPVPLLDAEFSIDEKPQGLIRARYMFFPVPLASLEALIDRAPPGRPIFDKSAAALLFMLFASAVHAVDHRAGFVSAFQTGYLLFDEPSFRRRVDELFVHAPPPIKLILATANLATGDEVVDALAAITGNPWPLEPGPILYRDGNALAVDLAAASTRLSNAVVYPRVQGAIQNARSEHFEDRVQAAVDGSRHAPPAEVRLLQRRTLKLRGRDVTDIDAIARVDSSLLLISCKAVIYSPEYDKGEARAVKSAAATVYNAVERWATVLDTLRAEPVGDNYDLSGWGLLGVVCTPSAVWVELGPPTAFVLPNLRAAVSLAELQAWLVGDAAT